MTYDMRWSVSCRRKKPMILRRDEIVVCRSELIEVFLAGSLSHAPVQHGLLHLGLYLVHL